METPIGDMIAAVRGGDTEAYAGIVRQYQDEVRRIAAFVLHDIAATEDLVQQVFIRAYTNLDKFDPGLDFGVWLRTIARNLLRNELRRMIREQRAFRSYREHLWQRLDDHEACDRHEAGLAAALQQCREALSDEARQALDLRYGRALGFEQVADALDRSVAAVRQLLTRVRGALRRCIEQKRTA